MSSIDIRQRQRYDDSQEPIHGDWRSPLPARGPLKLEKLRLKHINRPEYASLQVFDWIYLRELRLPHTDLDPAMVEDLQIDQLEVLEDVNCKLLSEAFIELISSQIPLRSSTFA